ncbi:MAG: M20/M25/M40 family metallo-hydrolase [Thermomicrobiales bacterium]|nr:M20/M25/M40 family metallo-hydrolase [Thermomicrobiales bacterium]
MHQFVPSADVTSEVTEILQALIRFDTTNPPGNENLAATWIVELLRSHGIDAELLEGVPGRGNVVARLRAEQPKHRPLLLMGHVDVVGVEREHWTHDPFGGEIDDGFIWGRGALDMKGQVAAELVAFIDAHRRGLPLDRDLILMATSDEEVGTGDCGIGWLAEHHFDKIDAEYAINEGGGNQFELLGQRFLTCAVGEKGGDRLRLTFRGQPGHASVPLPDTAMGRLGRALVQLAERRGPVILTETARTMLSTIAASLPEPHAAAFRTFLASPSWEHADALPTEGDFRLEVNAILTNTAVPTIVLGGHQINVIPSEVVLDVDGRILPGEDPATFRAEIQALVGEDVLVEPVSGYPGLEASPQSPFFDALGATASEMLPDAQLIPVLMTGATDAGLIPAVRAYGIFPLRTFERQELYNSLVHGHDERIAVDDLAFGAEFYMRLIERFCVSS